MYNSTDFPVIYNNLVRHSLHAVKERQPILQSSILAFYSESLGMFSVVIDLTANQSIKVKTNIVVGLQPSVEASFIANNTTMYPIGYFGFS